MKKFLLFMTLLLALCVPWAHAQNCPTPSGAHVEGLTDSTATLKWEIEAGSLTPDMFSVTLRDAAGELVSYNGSVYPSEFTFTNLTPSTTYTAYVRSNCDVQSYMGYSDSVSVQFTTPCEVINQFPYTMGFEDNETFVKSGTIRHPLCWTHYNNATSTTDSYKYAPYAATSNPRTGSRCLYYYNYKSSASYGDTATFALAAIDTTVYPLNALRVKFWTRNSTATSYRQTLYVGVMTDPNDPSTFTKVDSVVVTGATYTEKVAQFNNYTGNGSHIAFAWYKSALTSNYSYVYLDDVTVEPLPTCADLTAGATVTALSDSSATFTMGDQTATNWQYAYGATGTSVDQMTPVNCTGSTCTITGLAAATTYDLYVRRDCGAGDLGVWAQKTTFTTTNVPATIPYVCGFEDAQENAHWIYVDGAGANVFTIGTDTGAVYAGANAMYVTNNRATAPYEYNINSSGTKSFAYRTIHFDAKEYQLNLKFRMPYGEGGWDFGRIFLTNAAEYLPAGTSGTSLSNTTFNNIVAELDSEYYSGGIQLSVATATMGTLVSGSTTWHEISYSLDMTTRPGDYNLVLMWSNDNSGGTNPPLAVDDINITEVSCTSPSTIAENNLTATSVNLNIQQDDASQWEVVVNATPFTKQTIPATATYRAIVSNPIVSVTGLTPNTDYYYMVRTICGANDTSKWNTIDNFHTLCAAVNLPYSEDFENTTSINCWSNPGTGSISRNTDYHHAGSASMQVSAATAVLPELNVTTHANDMIAGWCYSTVDSVVFQIGVMTDPNDNSTFEPLGSVAILTKNTWTEFTSFFTLLLDPDEADWYNARYVVIKVPDGVTVYFDDIEVLQTPNCRKPVGVSVTNVTSNSFDISFDDLAGASQWIVYTNGTPNVITSNPATVSGLNGNTEYSVGVAAICTAADTSAVANYGTITTPCGTVSTPWSCGFETSEGWTASANWTEGVLEAKCWNTLGMKPSGNVYPYYRVASDVTYSHSSSNCLKFFSAQSAYCYTILPEFADPTDSLLMEFWYRNEAASSSAPYVEVGYMTDPTDDSTFVLLQQLPKVTSMTKAEQSFLDISVPRNARIAIREGGAGSSNYYCSIDDIKVTRFRTCSDPEVSTASNITAASADIAFSDTCATHAAWEYVYGPTGFNPDNATPVSIDTTAFSLSGLDDDTNYDVYVRAVCGVGDVSNYVKASFRTLCLPFHVTATNPFVEDFNSYNYNQYMNSGTCYTVLGEPATNSYWAKAYPTSEPSATATYHYYYGHSADRYDKCMYWNLNNPQILSGSILRQFHLDGGTTYEVSAWVRNGGSNNYQSKVSAVMGATTATLDTMKSIIVDGANATAKPVGGVNTYCFNEFFQQIKYYLTADSTGDYYIGYNVAFNNTSNYTYLFLDDWSVRQFTGCVPRVPSVDSVTTTSASFSVNDTSFYQYEYVLNDTTLTPTVTTTNTFSVMGLSSSTGYTLYCRRYCDAATYSEWADVQFTTACGAITSFPYTQDFEGSFLPACWSQRYYGSTEYTNAWTSSSSYQHSGSKCAYIPDKSYGSKTALTTCELMLTNPNGYEVTLWVYRQNTSYQNYTQEGMYIYVSDSPITSEDEVGDATQIGFVAAHYANTPAELSAGWYEYSFDIPTSLTGSRYVNVCYHNYYGSGSYFDDLTVAELPACRDPKVAPTITDSTMTTMSVQADMAGKDTIEFGIAPYTASVTSAAIYTTVISTDGNACFTGLTGSTQYAVWYRLYCGANGVSDWSTLYADATTRATDCYAPTNLRTVGSVNDHHAEITWNVAPLASRSDYELYQGTSTAGILVNSGSVASTDTLVYDSLIAVTNYFFRVRSLCSDDTTDWSTFSFKTTRATASLPFVCGFENATDITFWEMGDNSCGNAFVIGTGTSNGGAQSLYISNDGGSYSYSSNATQAYARVLIPMTAGNYLVSYDYNCSGETNYDYGRVFLYPAANAVGCISALSSNQPVGDLDISPSQISGMNNWATANYIITVPADALYYFQVNWRDDSSYAGYSPMAIDNISITEIDCMPLDSVVNVDLTDHRASYKVVRYEAGVDIQYGYSLVDDVDSISNWTTLQGAGLIDTIRIYGLAANTTYYLFARQACDSIHVSTATRVVVTTTPQAQTLPFICGFEPSEATTAAWAFANDATNAFVIGDGAAASGSNAMYISNDGSTWNYDTYSPTCSYAYVPLAFGPGIYDVEYEWQAAGETNYDYARVFLAPASFMPTGGSNDANIGTNGTPDGWISLDGDNKINMIYDWVSTSLDPVVFADSTNMNLIVYWRNDGSAGTQPPIAIDNISVIQQTCPPIQLSTLGVDTISTDMFTIRYLNPNEGASTMWILSSNNQYTDTIAMGVQPSTDSTFTVTGLTDGTRYFCRLYSLCGVGDTSKALKFDISTQCAVITQLPYTEGFEDFTPLTYNLLTGACWQTTTMNSSHYAVTSTASECVHSGAQGLYTYSTSNSGCHLLALPEIASLNGKTVSFWHKAYSTSSSYVTLSFGYLDTADTFVPLNEFSDRQTEWQEYTTTLQNLPAGVTRLAFKFDGYYKYYLDDISVRDIVNVTVNANDSTMGSVSGSGRFDSGTIDTLTATPNAHYHFTGWSNGSTDNPLYLTVTQDTNLTATFSIDQHTINAIANNSAIGQVTGSGVYDYNTPVTLIATPAADHHFVGWSNGMTNDTITVNATADMTLVATFAKDIVTIFVVAEGDPGATVTGAGTYEKGTLIPLTATPSSSHYTFDGWYEGDFRIDTKATTKVIAGTNATLIAKFNADNHTITAVPGNGGTTTGSNTYVHGSVATLTATPDDHYHFINWTDTNNVEVSTLPAISFHVHNDSVVNANFEIDTHNVALNASNIAAGSVEGAGRYNYGSQVQIIAVPAARYAFVQWSNGLTTDTAYIDLAGDTTVTAIFAVEKHTVALNVNNTAYGTVSGAGTYNPGDIVTVEATPFAHYHFVEWSNGLTANPAKIFVDQDSSLTATFAIDRHDLTIDVDTANGSVTGAGTYDYATLVTVVATPTDHSTFSHWSTGATTPTTVINLDKDSNIVAYFDVDNHTVTLNSNNVGMGSVTGAGTFVHGTTATITAIPAAHYHFVDWSNGLTDATAVINIESDTVITANFAVDTHVINVVTADAAMGSVTGTGVYAYGSIANIAAVPAAHHHFVVWSNGVNYDSQSFVVHGDSIFVANFAIDQHSVTVNVNPNEGVVTGAGLYDYGTRVRVTATPLNDHYTFTGWSNGETSPVLLVDLVKDTTLTANFTIDSHNVTLNVNNAGMGTVSGAGTYVHGTTATITATANDHFHFVAWSNGVTTATATINIESDTMITAIFAANEYNVTVLSNDPTKGIVIGGGTYEYGTTAHLYAAANDNYHFTGWSDGATAPAYSVVVYGDTTITAIFAANEYTVTGMTNDPNMGGVTGSGLYAYGTYATLTAVPAAHHHFVNWSNGETNATTQVLVNGDVIVAANFAVNQYNVTATADDAAAGYIIGAGSYNYGETITLVAVENDHYHFTHWSTGETNASINVTVNGDMNLVAYYAADEYEVSLIINGNGEVTGDGIYHYGDTVTITATPDPGYRFLGWGDGTTDSVYTFVIASDVTLTATFVAVATDVEDVEVLNYVAYTEARNIIVHGAADHRIALYDMAGRLVKMITVASEDQRFEVNAAGVYLIQVDELPATRVVIK